MAEMMCVKTVRGIATSACSPSWGVCSVGIQLSCHENTQATQWSGAHGEELTPPANIHVRGCGS